MYAFGPFLPDQPSYQSGACSDVLNVVPSEKGYRPANSFFNVTGATTARVQGAFTCRGRQGTIYNFCGDATKLYQQSTDGLTWGDVSRLAGGAYATATDGWWDFALFGDIVIATNGVDVPQRFQLDVDTDFSALGGSPPVAKFVFVIRDFVVLACHATANDTLTWCALGDCEDWVASATTLSDSQTMFEGGAIMGGVGGEYGVPFQERAISRMSFEGPPTVFRFDKISNSMGCRIERSIAAYENLIFFTSNDGEKMIRGGSEIADIGSEKIDRWFETEFDGSYTYRVSSAIDPVKKLYVKSFPNGSASSGTPNMHIAYHWPTGKFAPQSPGDHELIYVGATQETYTIDGLDALSGTIDGLPFPVDSRFYAGAGELILGAFNTDHKQGFYTGAYLAATIETGDEELSEGFKSLLLSLRPMIEGSSVTITTTIKYRNRLQDSHSTSSASAINAHGVCTFRINARYHRATINTSANDNWTHANGIADIVAMRMGRV
jgi:hypothetical protein